MPDKVIPFPVPTPIAPLPEIIRSQRILTIGNRRYVLKSMCFITTLNNEDAPAPSLSSEKKPSITALKPPSLQLTQDPPKKMTACATAGKVIPFPGADAGEPAPVMVRFRTRLTVGDSRYDLDWIGFITPEPIE